MFANTRKKDFERGERLTCCLDSSPGSIPRVPLLLLC
jgi:hypothetical protein